MTYMTYILVKTGQKNRIQRMLLDLGYITSNTNDSMARITVDTEIAVHDKLITVEYDYPKFHLLMDCYLSEVIEGSLVLKEHEAARWLKRDELDSVQWLPADKEVLDKIKAENLIEEE